MCLYTDCGVLGLDAVGVTLVGGLQEIADERRCLPASSAGFSGIGCQLLHHIMSKNFT